MRSRSCRASKRLTSGTLASSRGEVLDGLLRIGFVHHQRIIWDKGRTVLTRSRHAGLREGASSRGDLQSREIEGIDARVSQLERATYRKGITSGEDHRQADF
jgi:hypothetical protein